MEGNIIIDSVQHSELTPQKTNLLMTLMGLFLMAGVGAGIYAQMVGHHHAFANTRDVPWGMLIGVYAYFAIISTGLCIMAALTHLFHIKLLEPLANRMVWLSIIMLLSAFTVIGLEIENPWRMPLGVLFHPNLTSNIWWMGTLYGMAVGIMFVEFYLIVTGRFKPALILGLLGAVTEMFANSNLGSVFASLGARPFWYGAQLPIFFLSCAFLCGAAAVILFTHYAHLLRCERMSHTTFQALRFAGRLMLVMIFLVGLATAWKIANSYCGTEEMRRAADAVIRGPLAKSFWLFEIGIGLVLPMALLAFSRLRSLQALSLASLLVLVGQFVARYNLVVAGLIIPQYAEFSSDAPAYLTYSPAPAEHLLVVGGIGVMGLGFLIGEKKFAKLFSADNSESH
ncbi:NrfD/PsrC family molybdoenzyme membrane anchor subunit [Desulfopila sp. IMCC35008]|uniref:NrfD/PsrC family molybdoenzyme membrane anchor subunit n=1 Tax=Desulfopila sp. IMCC35008 TaxID=2653858 RepID=UPI0013D45D1F|nr:NrfD/PsrC family molybdoenzyme membrane anchor subunit [Desulfopila sp. IMCC35008]